MITIYLPESEKRMFSELYEQYPDSIDDIGIVNSFDGTTLLQIILEITRITIPVIASILISRNNRQLIFNAKGKDGSEITVPIREALSIEELMELLKQYSDETNS